MRVFVCGGRDYGDKKTLRAVLDELDVRWGPFKVVIHGNAQGADRLADIWAFRNSRLIERFPADWRTHGRAAGPIRNKRMLDEGKPDLVVAFPGGHGTANMTKQARAAGVEVIEVER